MAWPLGCMTSRPEKDPRIMSPLIALLLAVQTPQAAAIAGNYTATTDNGTQCALVLMPPARRPQGAMALMSGAAGLAAVSPDCNLPIAETMFWQLEEDQGSRIIFVDAAGDIMFTGEPGDSDRQWRGVMPDGTPVVLTPSR